MTRERTPQDHLARHIARHARRDRRWREQAARLVAFAMGGDNNLASWVAQCPALTNGFDVSLVRAYCERLISESDDLDAQREVFADWTRDRGLGPENHTPGAHAVRLAFWVSTGIKSTHPDGVCWYIGGQEIRVRVAVGDRIDTQVAAAIEAALPGWRAKAVNGLVSVFEPARGGWPGNLAREFVADQRKRRRCSRPNCNGGLLAEDDGMPDHYTRAMRQNERGEWRAVCHECENAALRSSRAFVNGGNMRAAAQRLLDTLDGRCPWAPDAEAQPSECGCVAVKGSAIPRGTSVVMHNDTGGMVTVQGMSFRVSVDGVVCTRCNGTGHNLRGTLPPLPDATRRKLETVPRQVPGTVEGEREAWG